MNKDLKKTVPSTLSNVLVRISERKVRQTVY